MVVDMFLLHAFISSRLICSLLQMLSRRAVDLSPSQLPPQPLSNRCKRACFHDAQLRPSSGALSRTMILIHRVMHCPPLLG